MIDHATYLATCERLRRVESGEGLLDVYGVYTAVHDMVDYDKITIYDAEHDTRPATVEWLQEVVPSAWSVIQCRGCVELWVRFEGQQVIITNPTRGDVLTLLRLFSERKV